MPEFGIADALAHWRTYPRDFDEAIWPDPEDTPDPWQDSFYGRITGLVRPCQVMEGFQSCAGAGKSHLLARAGIWSVLCLGEPDHPVLVTAFSMSKANLQSGLWRQLRLLIEKSPLLRDLLDVKSEVIVNRMNPESRIEARTWPSRANPDEIGDALSGIHGRYNVYLGDETGSIHSIVLNRCEQGVGEAGQFGMILLAGNPADRDSMLGAAEGRSNFKMTEITADPDDPNRTPRKTREAAQLAIDEALLGRDDPWVRVYILGKFPVGTVNTLLSWEAIEEARERVVKPSDVATFGRIMGVDVARDGLDPSVLFPRQGRQVLTPSSWRGLDGLQGAAQVNRVWREWDADACVIDMTGGWGASWFDQLRVLGRNPLPAVYGARANHPDRFNNLRSEMLWNVREGVLSGWALPSADEHGSAQFAEEATAIRYTIVRDLLCMEPKDKVKKRLGRSTDYIDALGQTTAYDIMRSDRQVIATLPPGVSMGEDGVIRAQSRRRRDR